MEPTFSGVAANASQNGNSDDNEPESAGITSAVAIAASNESAREIVPGTVLRNRYLIEKSLGIGGGSTVFSAVDRHRTQIPGACSKVAVKVLHPRFRQDKARVFRLIREFRQMQRLTHAGIARVFDLDCDAGVWFITMELLQGQSLRRQLQDELNQEDALRILTQCTEALAYAHDQGVIHGDLKPGNIFVTQDGRVRLLDFGSVPDQDETAATEHSPPHLAATLAYASPQLLVERDVEPRDDLFSLGCVAYELFSGGQHPFYRQPSLEAQRRGLRPADIPAMPAQRFAVITRMLSWERTARPASARDFLQAFLTADSSSGSPPPSDTNEDVHTAVAEPNAVAQNNIRAASPHRLRRTMLIALCLLIMVAGIVLARLWQSDTSRPAAAPTTAATPVASTAKSPSAAVAVAVATQEILTPESSTEAAAAASSSPRPAASSVAAAVSFQAATVRVGASQQMAVINVVREQPTGRAQVTWSIIAGTAKPGVDYDPPESQIARFNDGQRVRSLYIPLKHSAADSRPERRFRVKLQSAPGALAPGRIDTIEVVISAKNP